MQPALLETGSHLTDRDFRLIAELIETQVGIRLPEAKRLMIEGRLHKRVRALHCLDLSEYVERLFDDKNFETELVHLIDVVTTNKTDFFREPSHFDFMRNVAVPESLNRRGRATHPRKSGTAAYSACTEAYTTAPVLDNTTRTGSS